MLKGEISLRQSWPLYRKLTCLVVGLTGLGVVMVYNTTFAFAGQRYGDPYLFLKKDLLWTFLGLVAFGSVQMLSLEKLRRCAKPALIVTLFLLALVLAIGKEVNGATRWLSFKSISFQVSELAKITFILYLADFLSRKEGTLRNLRIAFLPPGILLGAGLALILVEPDLGTVGLLAGVILILYFSAGAPLLYLAVLGLAVIIFGGLMIYLEPFRMQRLLSFLDPWRDPLGSSYHVCQSLIGVGNGGLFGVGLGQGRQKLFFLPEAHTDFIFANIAEELGFFGSTLFLIPFFLLISWGFKVAQQEQDRFRALLATGITALLGLQTIIHIGVVLSIMPTKGITLPFISYGGSSLVFTLLSTGILVNIARQQPLERIRL